MLEKSFAEKYCREVEKCCRGVVGKSVGEECRELYIGEKCWRMLEKSAGEELWRRQL